MIDFADDLSFPSDKLYFSRILSDMRHLSGKQRDLDESNIDITSCSVASAVKIATESYYRMNK